MKTLLIVFSLLIVANCTATDRKLEELLTALKRLPPLLRIFLHNFGVTGYDNGPLSQQCPNSIPKLPQAMMSMVECTDHNDNTLTVCASIKKELLTCITPIVNVTEECMPEKLKGVLTFATRSFINALKYACGLTVEQFLELFNDCVTPGEDSDFERRIYEKLTEMQRDLSVGTICRTGQELRNLVKDHVVKNCPNEMTKTVLIGIVNALLQDCNTII